mgnify:CR=1 FL=1
MVLDVVPRIGAGRLPEGTLCLTFDDGPWPTTTAVLKALAPEPSEDSKAATATSVAASA